ncbi:MAG: helix-turn-helix domain-containing protein [Sphaerochaeta sp.]|uniref:helix-turn-helix domain-containing protein n=1 Tax=Sphaerochaeta sp. TaxID=1972642 RepID=UPI002FCB9EA4
MAAQHPDRIGLVLASIHTGASNGLWSEIARLAQQSGRALFVFPGGRLECKETQEYLRNAIYPLVNTENLQGAITWASTLGGSVRIEEVKEFLADMAPLACVTIGMKREGSPAVSFDAYAGIQSILLHCITKHHAKRIAFIRGPENHDSAQDRYRAYCDTLDQTGLMFDPRLISDPFPWTEGAKALDQLMEERSLIPGKDFDTLSCSSDMMMFDAGKRLEEKGYRIPEDVRILGYNDSSESHLLKVPCTTARLPVAELAQMSFTLLGNLLEEESSSVFDILLPSMPVIRRSCGCAYSLGSEEQARQVVGTSSSFRAWIIQNFGLDESESSERDSLLFGSENWDDARYYSMVEQLSYRFLDRGGDPNLLSEALHWYCTFFASDQFKATRANQIRDLFLRQRDLVAHEHAYALSMQAKRLNALKCDLLTVRSLSSIPSLLEQHLKGLGIKSGYLVLHEDDKNSLFIGGYDEKGMDEGQQRFPKQRLLPSALQENLEAGVYVIEPLFMDNQPLGYVMVQTTLFSGSVMEELRTALSSAVKGAFLLEAANRAREEAERAQRSRTEFLANVNESLRSPLEALLALANQSEGSLRDSMQQQLQAATHLLDLTLSHSGELELEKKLFNARILLDGLRTKTSGPDRLPMLYGDDHRLIQAFHIVYDHIRKEAEEVCLDVQFQAEGVLFAFSSSRSTWQASLGKQDPSLSLAQRIVLMSGGLVFLKENSILLRLPWPALEGESQTASTMVLYYLASDQEDSIPSLFAPTFPMQFVKASTLDTQHLSSLEGGVLGWDGSRQTSELQILLNQLMQHPRLAKAPFVCFHAPQGYENLGAALTSSLVGQRSKGVLVITGGVDVHIAQTLGMGDKVVECTPAELVTICRSQPVGLLISDVFSPQLFEEVRKHIASPIVLIRDRWTMDEAEQVSLIPRLVIAHRCVMDSSEFLARLVSLLVRQEVLPPLTGALVKRAVSYLGEHATGQISRWQLAEAINVSEDYLTRIFRKELGLSPWDYLNRHRICLATALLRQTTLTINEVASQTGFQDQAYFCRVFRKIKGMAPTKIRTNER